MRRAAAIALALAACSLAGCATLATAPESRTFRLTYIPPQPTGEAPLPAVVRIMPFGIAATYDREGFIFRSGPYDVGYDHYNRWLASPATMVTDLVARDLAASGVVQGVLQTPSALPADYELSAQIETMEERDDDGGCVAHLRLRPLLVRIDRRNRRTVVLQQSLVADEPCTPGDPESYAAAMSRATERLSTQIRDALVTAIREQQRAAALVAD